MNEDEIQKLARELFVASYASRGVHAPSAFAWAEDFAAECERRRPVKAEPQVTDRSKLDVATLRESIEHERSAMAEVAGCDPSAPWGDIEVAVVELKEERDRLRDALVSQRGPKLREAEATIETLRSERDKLAAELEGVTKERDKLTAAKIASSQGHSNELRALASDLGLDGSATWDQLRNTLAAIKAGRDNLAIELDNHRRELDKVTAERDRLTASLATVNQDHANRRRAMARNLGLDEWSAGWDRIERMAAAWAEKLSAWTMLADGLETESDTSAYETVRRNLEALPRVVKQRDAAETVNATLRAERYKVNEEADAIIANLRSELDKWRAERDRLIGYSDDRCRWFAKRLGLVESATWEDVETEIQELEELRRAVRGLQTLHDKAKTQTAPLRPDPPPDNSFMARCVRGEVEDPETAIHNEIDEWHGSNGSKPLHEFLGMTWEEYKRWSSTPPPGANHVLRNIIAERKAKQ